MRGPGSIPSNAVHFSNPGHDLAQLGRALDRFPNLNVDISAAEDRAKCLSLGMTDYLAKPVTMEALTAALERCAYRQNAAP